MASAVIRAIRAAAKLPLLVGILVLAIALGGCAADEGAGGNGTTANSEGTLTVVGTWRGSTNYDCLGQLSDEMIFKGDGHFSRLTTSTQVNCVPATLMVRTTGDYEVDPNLNVIRLTHIDTEPKEQCLPGGGCVPVRSVDSDTLTYSMPDSNSLTLSCGSGCSIEYARASG